MNETVKFNYTIETNIDGIENKVNVSAKVKCDEPFILYHKTLINIILHWLGKYPAEDGNAVYVVPKSLFDPKNAYFFWCKINDSIVNIGSGEALQVT